MPTLHFPAFRRSPRAGVLALAGLLSGTLAGCSDLKTSLLLSNAVLVKVPVSVSVAHRDSGDWHFQHVMESPRENDRVNHWYVVWNDRKPVMKMFGKPYWSTVFDQLPEIVDATRAEFGCDPLLVEPNHTFRYKPAAKNAGEPPPGASAGTGRARAPVAYRKLTTPVWPDIRVAADGSKARPGARDPGARPPVDPFWYKGKAYTELDEAIAAAGPARDGERIRIGHLDNGLDGRHPAAPRHLVYGDRWANAYGLLTYAQNQSRHEALEKAGIHEKDIPLPRSPEETGGTHGMGTIGILAGGKVHVPPLIVDGVTLAAGYDREVGGAPEARVFPMRVAPSFVSLSTGELAYAIDYASRVNHCDVISMSHGGTPSLAWVDAVNAAYDRGTAMFAAESDFISLSIDPLPTMGIVLPSSPVYPAAFRRVLGVTGVTAEGASYGRNSLWRLLHARTLGDLGKWALRGSYGADGTSTVFFRPNHYPDGSELKRGGALRPQPIAAYSPNIPWLAVSAGADKEHPQYVIDLDGAGTSASTPQVAAAAALWLQKHRHEFSAREWHGWQKPEAVYCALLKTAYLPRHPDRPDHFLGAGILKASQALGVSYAQVKRMKKPPGPAAEYPAGRSLYFAKSGRDHFDAQRSFLGLIGLDSLRNLRYDQRADLFQGRIAGGKRADEVRRFFYNSLLLRAWQGGHLPDKYRGADRLWIEADKKVPQVLPKYHLLAEKELLLRVRRLCPRPPDTEDARVPEDGVPFPPE